jgi:hypothetical protein
MPLNLGNLQTDYNNAKTSLAAVQAAEDALAAAMLTHEQNCEVLETDGWSGAASWFRQQAAATSSGYQTFGNGANIVTSARKPGVARDLSVVNSIGPIISSAPYKDLQALAGFNLTP